MENEVLKTLKTITEHIDSIDIEPGVNVQLDERELKEYIDPCNKGSK
jgi:hypothetical protein